MRLSVVQVHYLFSLQKKVKGMTRESGLNLSLPLDKAETGRNYDEVKDTVVRNPGVSQE